MVCWFVWPKREREAWYCVLNKIKQIQPKGTELDLWFSCCFFLLGRECCPKWPVWLLDGWWFFPSRTQAAPNLVRGGGGFAGRDGNSPRHCIHCLAVLHPNQHHRLARRKFTVLFFSLTTICNFTTYFGRGSPRRCPPSTLPKRRPTWDTLGATTWSCADEQRTARRCHVQLVHRVNASYHLLMFKFWHLRSKLLYKLVTIKSL